jgi:hypothetical protein
MSASTTPYTRVLRGPEHAAMERLIRACEICATARTYLDATGDDQSRARSHQGAVTSLLVLGPAAPKLGAALVAAATNRPGGAAQLTRVSRDVERILREMPAFPDSHRVANASKDRRRVVEDTLGDLLRETALELHDLDLAYAVNEAGEHVFTWREESQDAVEMMLLEGLMLKMELMVQSQSRPGFEHIAGAWWYKQFAVEWTNDVEPGMFSWRMRAWSLADRVVPSLGATAAQALPHHELWSPLSARQRSLVRAFAASIPGLFVLRTTTAHGVVVEDLFDGRRYELKLEDAEPTPPPRALYHGRLIPRDGGVYLASPGTATFELAADLPHAVSALLREHPGRADRAVYAEMLMGRLQGTPAEPRDDVSAAEAAVLLASYDAKSGEAGRIRMFKVPGATPLPPDEATLAWIAFLQQRAAE